MLIRCLVGFLALSAIATLGAQPRPDRPGRGPGLFGDGIGPTLPDGRSRTLLMLKKEAEKSSEDMALVIELACELWEEIDRGQFHTVDIGSVRKAEQIIRIVRRVKGRLSKAQ